MATNSHRPGIRREDVAAWLATQPLDSHMGAYRVLLAAMGLSSTQWLLVTDAYRQAARSPLAGLVAAFDAERARCEDRSAPQSHAAHPGCWGGLARDCQAPNGPLPPLAATWYAQPLSRAAKCFNWPQGCGEYARRPGGGPAVLRHRDGCPNAG